MADDQVGFGSTFFLPLTRDQFAALGIVAAMFGQIESFLDKMILKLSGLKDEAALEAFYDGKQFGSKVNLLRRLKKDAPVAAQPSITALCDALDEASSARNQAIHGQWGIIDAEGEPEQDGKVAAVSPKYFERFLLAEGLGTLANDIDRIARTTHEAAVALGITPAHSVLPLRLVIEAAGPFSSQPKSEQHARKPNAPRDRKK